MWGMGGGRMHCLHRSIVVLQVDRWDRDSARVAISDSAALPLLRERTVHKLSRLFLSDSVMLV